MAFQFTNFPDYLGVVLNASSWLTGGGASIQWLASSGLEPGESVHMTLVAGSDVDVDYLGGSSADDLFVYYTEDGTQTANDTTNRIRLTWWLDYDDDSFTVTHSIEFSESAAWVEENGASINASLTNTNSGTLDYLSFYDKDLNSAPAIAYVQNEAGWNGLVDSPYFEWAGGSPQSNYSEPASVFTTWEVGADPAVTPVITSISPEFGAKKGGYRGVLTGTDFKATGGSLTPSARIFSWGDTSIEFEFAPGKGVTTFTVTNTDSNSDTTTFEYKNGRKGGNASSKPRFIGGVPADIAKKLLALSREVQRAAKRRNELK